MKSGHLITVVALDPNETRVTALTGPVAFSETVAFSRNGVNPQKDIKSIISQIEFIRRVKPRSRHSLHHQTGHLWRNCSTGCRRKSFYSNDCWPKLLIRRRAKDKTQRRWVGYYRLCHVVIFQNLDHLQMLEEMGLFHKTSNVGIVNHCGVALVHFAMCEMPPAPVFLIVARLLIGQGVREYVDASERVRKSIPGDRTLIVVGFDLSPNSIAQAKLDSWMVEKIEYFGRLDGVRLADAQSGVSVLPSYRVQTPRFVLAYLAMGWAIITTNVLGCRETVIQGENGLLVAPSDV